MRSYAAQELIDRVRDLCDIKGNGHITDDDIMRYLDHAYPRTWGLLAEASPPEHMLTSVQFNTVAGQIRYDITKTVGNGGIMTTNDFWKVKTVYVIESTTPLGGELRSIEPINEFNRLWFRAPQAAWPVQLDYIQACPKITSRDQVLDGINGWEEHMVALACQDVLRKRKEDAGPFVKQQKEVEEEIRRLAMRDAGFGERIVRRRHHDPYFLFRNSLDGYRLRGDFLELYYRSGYRAVP